MLNLRENMLVIDGQIKTSQIARCAINDSGDKYNIAFNNNPNKIFSYSRNRAMWLTNPVTFDPQYCHIYHNGRQLWPLAYIAAFQRGYSKYWYVEYPNGSYANYLGEEISFVKSCFEDQQSKSVFEYLRSVAAINPLKSEDDDTPLLLRQYQGIDFISNNSAVAPYLNPKEFQPQKYIARPLIFPFGCNANQQKAVHAAFENQISIIQGPPGTGKTQTILNIVANIILQGKTVMLVSNNNSAIENVVEKMEHYNMGFISAMLGSRANKDAFIATQETEKLIPSDIEQWHAIKADKAEYLHNLNNQSKALADVFAKQERLALARQELDALKVERTHFEQEIKYNGAIVIRKSFYSAQLITLWNELQAVVEGVRYSGIFAKIVNAIRDYRFRRKLHKIFTGVADKPTLDDIASLIPVVQRKFYEVRHSELVGEIASLERALSSCDASAMMKQLQEQSMCYLRNSLYHKYGTGHERPIFAKIIPELIKEYPLVLSTTFSSRTNFQKDNVFDFVIMDEASQISAETGALALMCAKNAVIVGDSMQLPNVVTQEDKLRLQAIAMNCNIDERYDCSKNSFLQSVIKVLPEAPQTLLREHYRCHPKIINFCNQKFYGGKLIIMTKDNGEEDVISAKRTVAGHHARGKMNQREIEVVMQEVLPTVPYPAEEIGIIAPYNGQVDALNNAVGGRIDVATVHKFQGREKDAIVMSTVDDTITEFSDDPNLLNVAISRAKQKFCIVVSGNEQPKDCNIADLLAYIEYNNCTVTDSNIHSIFDLLYD
nr:AAA family ATPase [Bacteroidales bacterium]